MLETVLALVLAHLVADFALQTEAMVKNKSQALTLLRHIGIVALTAWIALGFAPAVVLILFVAGTHAAIDWLKIRFGGPGFPAFITDQAAHIGALIIGAMLFPEAYWNGLWPHLPPDLAQNVPTAMALAAGLIATVWAGGYAVKSLMTGLEFPVDPASDTSLPQGGRLIGQLERLMILMLVITGETGGIGLLIAAKSVLRFSEVARDKDRRVSEYVIIGTLASFAWALGVAFATNAALTSLATP